MSKEKSKAVRKLERKDEEFAEKRFTNALDAYKTKMNHLASYEYLSNVVNDEDASPRERNQAAISLMPYQLSKLPTTVDINQKTESTVNHNVALDNLKELIKIQKQPDPVVINPVIDDVEDAVIIEEDEKK